MNCVSRSLFAFGSVVSLSLSLDIFLMEIFLFLAFSKFKKCLLLFSPCSYQLTLDRIITHSGIVYFFRARRSPRPQVRRCPYAYVYSFLFFLLRRIREQNLIFSLSQLLLLFFTTVPFTTSLFWCGSQPPFGAL